jgi:hypothetical protein
MIAARGETSQFSSPPFFFISRNSEKVPVICNTARTRVTQERRHFFIFLFFVFFSFKHTTHNTHTMANTLKRKAPSTSTDGKNVSSSGDARLELARAMKALSTAFDQADKRTEALRTLHQLLKEDIELRFEQKTRQISELEEEYNHRRKTQHVQLNNEFKELGMAKVNEILESRKEIAIPKTEYLDLQARLQSLPAEFEQEKKKLCETLARQHQKELKDVEKHKMLESQATLAEHVASKSSHAAQIKLLQETIDALRAELTAQRSLTGQVAGVRTNELHQMQLAAQQQHQQQHGQGRL